MPFLQGVKTSFVCVLSACIFFQLNASAQDACKWPMTALVTAGGAANPTTTIFEFTKPDPGGDLIAIRETTFVVVEKLRAEFPRIVQESPDFVSMMGRLNCQNRADDFQYQLYEKQGLLYASFSVSVEKYWCASADVPCPTLSEPLRICRKDSNGKAWGARIGTLAKMRLESDLSLTTVNFISNSSTSPEQNFMRDLLSGSFFGTIGIAITRKFENDSLSSIKKAIENGFQSASYTLPGGGSFPDIPNYEPIMTSTGFTTINTANGSQLAAKIVRTSDEYRESSGCYFAREIDARPPPSSTKRRGRD
jgi:hypothetical protein